MKRLSMFEGAMPALQGVRAALSAIAGLLTFGALGASAQPAPIAPSSAPNFLSQSIEVQGDWIVACVVRTDSAKFCSMAQQLSDQKSGQTIMRIEIHAPAKDGSMLAKFDAPFGMRLTQPIEILLGGQPAYKPSIEACLPPRGCVGEFSIPARDLAKWKQATALALRFRAFGQDESQSKQEPVNIVLSVKGLGAGFDRLAAMAK